MLARAQRILAAAGGPFEASEGPCTSETLTTDHLVAAQAANDAAIEEGGDALPTQRARRDKGLAWLLADGILGSGATANADAIGAAAGGSGQRAGAHGAIALRRRSAVSGVCAWTHADGCTTRLHTGRAAPSRRILHRTC
jgi:hypothetical protein